MQKVVALVREQVAQAAGRERAQQLRQALRIVLFEERVEVTEPGWLPRLRVVAGERMVEGGPTLGTQPLADHHLDQPPERADPLEQLFGIRLVQHERVHALACDAGREHAAAGRAGHVGVLALGIDHVGDAAAADAPEHAQLGRERLARAGTRQHSRVGVQVRPVPGVVDDRRAGAQARMSIP